MSQPHLEGHFYTHVRKYCARHGISIEINDIETQNPPQGSNEFIMDIACSDPEISDNDCKQIYYCKSYLQVKWKSDLMTAFGDQLADGTWEGYRMYQHSSSKKEEISQDRPSSSTWKVWNKFLIKHLCNKDGKAYIPLAGWRVDPNTYERLWPFYFSEKEGYIYRSFRKKWYSKETYTYEVYSMIDDDETRYSFDKVRDIEELPVDAIPVTIIAKETEWYLEGYYETEYRPPTASLDFDFRSFLRKQEKFITQYYDHIDFLPSQPARDENNDIIGQTYIYIAMDTKLI